MIEWGEQCSLQAVYGAHFVTTTGAARQRCHGDVNGQRHVMNRLQRKCHADCRGGVTAQRHSKFAVAVHHADGVERVDHQHMLSIAETIGGESPPTRERRDILRGEGPPGGSRARKYPSRISSVGDLGSEDRCRRLRAGVFVFFDMMDPSTRDQDRLGIAAIDPLAAGDMGAGYDLRRDGGRGEADRYAEAQPVLDAGDRCERVSRSELSTAGVQDRVDALIHGRTARSATTPSR